VPWTIDQCTFSSDFRILPLSAFDAIVGMDWLSTFSPMQVHWREKWLLIPYHGNSVLLQGIDEEPPSPLLLQLYNLSTSSSEVSSQQLLPAAIQAQIDSFLDLFTPPVELPPSRACNHSIPLLPGASPVFIRPYRYPLGLKDEIERQVNDMLSQGIIQPSTSPFSSPVLLVKKKDGSYRFCVDFYHLNALTAKSKFLVPVFGELMDELA